MNPISFGVSSTLQADFELLRETPNLHGEAKYSKNTIDKLAQYIVCRNYGRLCLELCYLCWPIVKYGQQGQALLDFFWLQEQITPKAFRSSISKLIKYQKYSLTKYEELNQSPVITLDDIGLKISHQQQAFTISATRIALISAFLEWLCSHFSGFIDELENNLNVENDTQVKKLASLIQQRIYALLKEHLPSANVQQKFRFIHDWSTTHKGYSRFNDEQVLQFWQAAFEQEGYVKYQGALLDIIDYEHACELNENKAKVAQANNIDDALFEYHESELNNQVATSLFELFTECIDELPDFSCLSQKPKLISKQQLQDVSLLLENQDSIQRLPLSLLRSCVFSPWQAQIIQLTRNKQGFGSNEVNNGFKQPTRNYEDYNLVLDKWIENACSAMLSCVGVLYEMKDPRCLATLQIALSKALDEHKYASFLTALRKADIDISTFSDVSAVLLSSPLLKQYMQLALKQLKANNREGFRKGSVYADSDIYYEAIASLHLCVETLLKFKKATVTMLSAENYRSDLFIFTSEFKKRHGGIDG